MDSGRRMLKMELQGRRKRGRPQRFIDVVNEDMQRIGLIKEDARYRAGVGKLRLRSCMQLFSLYTAAPQLFTGLISFINKLLF